MTEFEITFALVMILCWIVTVITTRAEIKATKEDLMFIRSMTIKNSAEFHEELNSLTRLTGMIVEGCDNRRIEINDLKDRIDKLEDALDELGKLDIPTKMATLEDAIVNDPNNDNYDDIVSRLEKIEAAINGDEDVEFDASEEAIVI